jgi:lipopolysaccharide transport system permease protein
MNEFKIRFARSKLGGFWMILQPLSQVLIYALILSTVMGAKLPTINNRYAYALYLMSGTLAWTFFNEIVTRCLTLFVDKANLIKKMQFPCLTLPVVVIGSALLNNLMLLFSILVIFSLLGHYPASSCVWFPILTLANAILAVGIGLILGVFNVFMRDLTHIMPILLQLLFWATPIVYPITIIPEHLRHYLYYNPLYPLVERYQNLFLYDKAPDIFSLVFVSSFALIIFFLGVFVFRRASPEMADVL